MPLLETKFTRLLGIKYPIIQAGMIWVSGAKLASAVANEGGLGLIGSGSMKPELLREHIVKANSMIDEGIFGVNIPLMSKYAEDLIQVTIEEKVRIVVTAAGSPQKYTSVLKESGIIVGHVVPSSRLAVKCEESGVDFVIAEGTEAGGHNSPDEITTMVLIPQVVDAVEIPVIAAGGIADGRAIIAALALGADGVQIGTRFAATAESSASDHYKAEIVKAGESDTVLTLKKLMPTRMLKTPFAFKAVEAVEKCASKNELSVLLGSGRAKKGIFLGNYEEGEYEAGQVSGLIKDIPPAGEIMKRLVLESIDTYKRMSAE